MNATVAENHAAAIWERIVHPDDGDLALEEARRYLTYRFTKEDQRRVSELSARARQGELTPDEEHELDDYLSINSFLACLQAKARTVLRRANLPA